MATIKDVLTLYDSVESLWEDSGLQAFTELSEELSQAGRKLDVINDGLQTAAQLQNQVYTASQNAGSSFSDMADAVYDLQTAGGGLFSSTGETVEFAQLMEQALAVGGADDETKDSAMETLTGVMSSGTLSGDDAASFAQNAPVVAQSVEDYLPGTQSFTQLAEQGLVTAQVIKDALSASGDEIEAKFNSMPMTFSDAFSQIKNDAELKFAEIMTNVNAFLNSVNGEQLIEGIKSAIGTLGAVIGGVLTAVMTVGSFIVNNWGIIAPIVWGIVAAVIAYNAAMLMNNTIKAVSAIVAVAHGAATAAESAATAGMTEAQLAFNAALLASPLTWIVIAIIAVIAVICIAIVMINKAMGDTVSVIGVIAGVILCFGAVILDTAIGLVNALIQVIWLFVEPFIGIVEFILNATQGGFDSLGGAVANLIGQMISWFLSLGKVATKIIDAIAGTDLTSDLDSLQDTVLGWGKTDDAITLSRDAPTLDRIDWSDAYSTGYDWGSNLENSFSLDGLFGTDDSQSTTDDTQSTLDNIATSSASTADSVSGLSDSVDIAEEDLKVMRDLAELQSIQNFVSLTPTVQVTTGDLNSGADVDDLVTIIERKLTVEIAASSAAIMGVA
ncbi:MAG: phage tail tape measure protein [Oscillospiraceae bacterium]|nr:phage tail tape measure protein [Oscillospiraceae bacterium]